MTLLLSEESHMKTNILIVEDSKTYVQIIGAVLDSYDNFSYKFAETGSDALKLLKEEVYDLVLLDVNLPDMEGYQICDLIRTMKNTVNLPVIFLSGKLDIDDKLKGFEHGADDYITKPFHHKELMARIKVQLKKQKNNNNGELTISDLMIDQNKQTVRHSLSDQLIELTRIEFKLLSFFAEHPDWVLSREKILDKIWTDKVSISDRAIDTHISNLRKKLKESLVTIESVHGSGYKLKIQEDSAFKKSA